MTPGRHNQEHAPRERAGFDGAAMSPDQLVDAVLDREVPHDAMGAVMARIASDPAASARLASMTGMFDALRAPVGTPDLTRAVIGEVGRRRRWLAPALQRAVGAGRLAIAAALLCALAVGLVAQRAAPESGLFSADRATPLANVVEASQAETTAGIRNVAGMLDAVRGRGANEAGTGGPVAIRSIVFVTPYSPNGVQAAAQQFTLKSEALVLNGQARFRVVGTDGAGAEMMLVDPTGRERGFVVQLRTGVECERREGEARWAVLPRER
jgi:hypothetical protein